MRFPKHLAGIATVGVLVALLAAGGHTSPGAGGGTRLHRDRQWGPRRERGSSTQSQRACWWTDTAHGFSRHIIDQR